MARSDRTIPAEPLFKRLGSSKGGASAFAKRLRVSEQVVSNWKRRGIPAHQLTRIAAALGITAEVYLGEAGRAGAAFLQDAAANNNVELVAKLLDDFRALPPWLQEHVARVTAELRAYADALPAMVREGMKAPPKDPEAYKSWRRQIEVDVQSKLGSTTIRR